MMLKIINIFLFTILKLKKSLDTSQLDLTKLKLLLIKIFLSFSGKAVSLRTIEFTLKNQIESWYFF